MVIPIFGATALRPWRFSYVVGPVFCYRAFT